MTGGSLGHNIVRCVTWRKEGRRGEPSTHVPPSHSHFSVQLSPLCDRELRDCSSSLSRQVLEARWSPLTLLPGDSNTPQTCSMSPDPQDDSEGSNSASLTQNTRASYYCMYFLPVGEKRIYNWLRTVYTHRPGCRWGLVQVKYWEHSVVCHWEENNYICMSAVKVPTQRPHNGWQARGWCWERNNLLSLTSLGRHVSRRAVGSSWHGTLWHCDNVTMWHGEHWGHCEHWRHWEHFKGTVILGTLRTLRHGEHCEHFGHWEHSEHWGRCEHWGHLEQDLHLAVTIITIIVSNNKVGVYNLMASLMSKLLVVKELLIYISFYEKSGKLEMTIIFEVQLISLHFIMELL